MSKHKPLPRAVKQLTTLGPIHASRVSKLGKQKTSHNQARRISHRMLSRSHSQTFNGEQKHDATAQSVPRTIIPRRSCRKSKKPASSPERSEQFFLGPSHSSKVSKRFRRNQPRAPQRPRVIRHDNSSRK